MTLMGLSFGDSVNSEFSCIVTSHLGKYQSHNPVSFKQPSVGDYCEVTIIL